MENVTSNSKYDLIRRLRRRYTGLNWDDNAKLEKTLAVDNDDKDEVEDPKAKSRQLRREKLRQKQAVAVANVITCQ